MTDAALLAYVQEHGLGCGRFRADQLDRLITEPMIPAKKWWIRMAASLGLLFSLAKEAGAQVPVRKAATETAPRTSEGTPGTDEAVFIFSGTVACNTPNQYPRMPGAGVSIPQLHLQTMTDPDGHFELRIPSALLQDSLIVEIQAIVGQQAFKQYNPLRLRWKDIAAMKEHTFILSESIPSWEWERMTHFMGYVVMPEPMKHWREIAASAGNHTSRIRFAPAILLDDTADQTALPVTTSFSIAALMKRLPSFVGLARSRTLTWARFYPWLKRKDP